MRTTRMTAIACKISRGGFSDERVFSILIGENTYQGVASRRHMWTEDRRPVEDGEPPIGQVISGFVAARVIQINKDTTATVSIPDGEVITIPVSQLVDRPTTVGEHVPLGS
jgi:hypothetical protein